MLKKAKKAEYPRISGVFYELRWKQKKPTSQGLYLRVNAGHRVCFEHVKSGKLWGDRVLRILWGEVWTPVRDVRGDWWWYGPIPEPPKEAK